MRIFITGASGYIGFAVAEAFSQAGHRVYGLVRSEEKAKRLFASEIVPVIGDLSHPESFAHQLEAAEVIIHCAFEMSPRALQLENKVIDAILQTTANSKKTHTLLYTSGVWVFGNTGTQIADECSPLNAISMVKWRVQTEERIMSASSKHLRTVILRPGVVYGGTGGLTSPWFESLTKGSVEIAGDGQNRWAMIHYRDLAEAYVLAAEKELDGIAINIIDNSHDTIRETALAIARAGGIPGKINPSTVSEAFQKFGPLAEGLLADQQFSNERARRLLSWYPKHPRFIDNIDLYYHARTT